MRVVYYADDGREFESEKECREYEKELSNVMHALLNGVHAYDHKKRPINFEGYDADNMDVAFEEVYFVQFDNQNAADVFMQKARDFGCPCFEYDLGTRPLVAGERYFYDDKQDGWCCLEDKQKELDKIAAIFK